MIPRFSSKSVIDSTANASHIAPLPLARISHHHEQSRQILAKLPGETCARGRAGLVGLAVAVGGVKSSNFGRCARAAIPATRRIELQQTDRSVGDRPWRKTTEVCPDLREQRSPGVALGQRDPHFAERHANLRPDLSRRHADRVALRPLEISPLQANVAKHVHRDIRQGRAP